MMGKIKRTDWLPVGGDEANEQIRRDHDSQSTGSDSEALSENEFALFRGKS